MKKLIFKFICGLLVISMNSCNSDSNTPDAMDGVWESVGYGRLVKIQNGEFLLADITDISCIPMMDGSIADLAKDALKLVNNTLILKDGINDYAFVKIDDAPQTCKDGISEEMKKDPIFNFEVLAHTFKNHYAYFEVRSINWDTLYNEYRSKITPQTTDAELYVAMNEMLNSFNDGHIGLSAPDDIEEAASNLKNKISVEGKDSIVKQYNRKEVSDAIATLYIKNGKSKHNEFIRWGIISDSIGYLQVNQMMGYANYGIPDTLSRRDYYMAYFEKAGESSDSGADELEGLKPTLDEAMNDLKNTKVMIIDLRFNGGGEDMVALEILSRFNDKQQQVFTKKAKHGNNFTKENQITLRATANAYTKPVYLLIGDGSASATEIMVLSSLPLSHIKRVGSPTNGVFSDILEKTLPNGWEFGLSNEIYLDMEGTNYEGVGIDPDIDMTYPNDRQSQFRAIVDAVDKGSDPGIQKVIEMIANRN